MKTEPTPDQENGRTLWAEAWARLRTKPMVRVCLVIIAVYTILAFYGEGVYRYYRWKDVTPPYKRANLDEQYMPPALFRPATLRDAAGVGPKSALQSRPKHSRFYRPLGTDYLGRDVLQKIVQGARIAFYVGIITSLIAIPIGVVLGCLAGYFGGRLDDVIVWLYTTVASIPNLLLILAIAQALKKGLVGVYLGIGLTTWVSLCRLIRAEVMKHKARAYVTAARALGIGHFSIMFRHILPNIFHIVIITFSLRFPAAIGTEVILSFIGIGVQDEPSWGVMISDSRMRLWLGIWWEFAFATVAIFLIVLAFNLLGDALRDALDPRLRTERD